MRSCPALLDKQKAKQEAIAHQTHSRESGSRSGDLPDAKRPRREQESGQDGSGKQNVQEPFKPPYVEELYVGALEGIEGEQGMSILVSSSPVRISESGILIGIA